MPLRPQAGKIALVLQGGGARGAYHAGVIKALAEIADGKVSPFQIICGSSVGSINAAAVAMSAVDFSGGAARLERLWRSLRSGSIYDARATPLLLRSSRWAMTLVLGHLGLRMSGGFLDYRPLRDLLAREFSQTHLRHAIKPKALHALCITASSYSEGTSITFFQGDDGIEPWARSRRRGERAVLGPDHILASSALPFAFAPVRIGTGVFGDGALRATSPLSPAIHTGAERILVVATRDGIPGPATTAPAQDCPSFGEIAGHALDILFNDNFDADVERLQRINRTVSLLPEAARRQTPLRRIEALTLAPSRDIREIAKDHVDELPTAMRLLMRSIGYRGGDARIESYLLFEPGYIASLIALGHRDTLARSAEIRSFLAA